MLTDEERKIAEENHNLIYFFINHFNVDIDEYYDIFAIDYIKCVKFWDKDRGKLSTLLCKVFLNTIIKEKRKKKVISEIKLISLNLTISKENKLKLEDVIPDIKANVDTLLELKEDIEFFQKYDETKLLMEGFSIEEIAIKLNVNKNYVLDKIKYVKKEYLKQEIKEIIRGGGSRWINQKGKRANFICTNGQRVF